MNSYLQLAYMFYAFLGHEFCVAWIALQIGLLQDFIKDLFIS
jgi:hypothetical protein